MADQSLNEAEVLAKVQNRGGQPQVLDETKRRKILALLANGSSRRGKGDGESRRERLLRIEHALPATSSIPPLRGQVSARLCNAEPEKGGRSRIANRRRKSLQDYAL